MFRSITETVKGIKDEDPESGITEYLIRRLCANKTIKTIRSGKKVLVNVNSLREYLAGDKKEN